MSETFSAFCFYEKDVNVKWFMEPTNIINENQMTEHVYLTQQAFRPVPESFSSRVNDTGGTVVTPIPNLSPEAEQSHDNGRSIAMSFAFTEARKTATSLQKDFNKTEYPFFSLHSR